MISCGGRGVGVWMTDFCRHSHTKYVLRVARTCTPMLLTLNQPMPSLFQNFTIIGAWSFLWLMYLTRFNTFLDCTCMCHLIVSLAWKRNKIVSSWALGHFVPCSNSRPLCLFLCSATYVQFWALPPGHNVTWPGKGHAKFH